MNIALQVPAFEEPGLTDTLNAWANQHEPPGIQFSYEVWVTPSNRGDTWRQAEMHKTFSAHEAPQYKLRARNEAHSDAVGRGVDAFITADADAPPLNRNVLSALTAPLNDPGVAAVISKPVSPTTPVGLFSNLGVFSKELIGGIHGQCHLLTSGAWEACGPFSDDVDHTSLQSVWVEEELGFGRRLHKYGKVVYERDAAVRNDTRRVECRIKRLRPRNDPGDYCSRIGSETFAPQKRS